jgi:hypothetical protein
MRTPLCLLALAILGLAGLDGCSRDKAPPPATGSGSSVADTAAPDTVELFVNDTAVGKIQLGQLTSWPRLDTLVPPDARKLGTWEMVTLFGAKKTPTELPHPSGSYPDMVPAIFPGTGGGVSFGMFDPVELARKGKAALREDHVWMIRLKVAQGGNRGQNDDGNAAAGDPSKLVVTIKSAAGTTTITGTQLLGLPREPMPGNADQKGWRVSALLDLAGVSSYQHLVLTDASGTSLNLDKADVSATSIPFIKLNKQGALRLRVLKKTGDGWNPSGDLRALVAIEAR